MGLLGIPPSNQTFILSQMPSHCMAWTYHLRWTVTLNFLSQEKEKKKS